MMEIQAKELRQIGVGRSCPFRYKNLVVKLEKFPKWDGFDRQKETISVKREHDAYHIVKSLGVYTPTVELVTVNLIDGDRSFTTQATIREWQDIESFESFDQLCLAVPQLCHRIDFQYIIITDLWIANWDRRPSNLLYDKLKDVLVPIDYDAALSFDEMPCSLLDISGVKKLFAPYIVDPMLSGMLDFDILVFGELYAYLKKMVNYSLMALIDRRLIDRIINCEDALKKYIIDFGIGKINRKGE